MGVSEVIGVPKSKSFDHDFVLKPNGDLRYPHDLGNRLRVFSISVVAPRFRLI